MRATEEEVKRQSGSYDLSVVKRLRFKRQSVDDVGVIGTLHDLLELDLSHNRLESLEGLGELRKLKVLNVAHNRLKSLRGIEQLSQLETLFVQDNNLVNFDRDVGPYLSKLKQLKAVHFCSRHGESGNPFCTEENNGNKYPSEYIKRFPNVQVWDGERVILREIAQLEELDKLCSEADLPKVPSLGPLSPLADFDKEFGSPFGEEDFNDAFDQESKLFYDTLKKCNELLEEPLFADPVLRGGDGHEPSSPSATAVE